MSNPVIKSSRAPPVLPKDKGNVVSQEIPGVEKVEERDLLDNLFFTFCCGDNLTCLKANMVRRRGIFNHFPSFFFLRCAMVCSTVQMVKMSPNVRKSQRILKKSITWRKMMSW